MAAKPLFIDSGGFYALISPQSEVHQLSVAIMEEAAHQLRRAITTDYVIDETATLLRARGLSKLLAEFFRLTEESQALSVEWTTPDRFAAARQFMLKHLDQEFSFTDCVNFVVMGELRLNDALATDNHFRIAGFNPLLADQAEQTKVHTMLVIGSRNMAVNDVSVRLYGKCNVAAKPKADVRRL